MTNAAQTYSTRSTASRGAKRALGHNNFAVLADENGRWYWEEVTEGDEVVAEAIADTAPVEIEVEETEEQFAPYPEPAPVDEKARVTYKDLYNNEKSTLKKPVQVVHDFLDLNPDLGRKESIVRLVAMGVNYSTARTQYQRWFEKKK